MNKKLLSILMATTILAAGAVVAQAPAPETQDAPAAAKVERPRLPKRFNRERQEEMAKKMAEDLGLTAEQQAQADKIRKDGIAKVEPLMKEMKELRDKIDAERRANMEEFEKILTPEQKEKLKEIKARGIEKFKRRIDGRPVPGMHDQQRPERPMPGHHMDEGTLPPPPAEGEILPPPAEAELLPPPEIKEIVVEEGIKAE